MTLELHFTYFWSLANVLHFNLIPCMTCFEVFFRMTYFFNLDLLWPWPVTFIAIVHSAYEAKFVRKVNIHLPAKFHAFVTIWNILVVFDNTQAHYTEKWVTHCWYNARENVISILISDWKKWCLILSTTFVSIF